MTQAQLGSITGEAHEREQLEARLLQLGSRWQKNGMDRIYFNDVVRLYGLELDHYNTGNICHATLRGEHISNTSARRIAGRLSVAKVWYDLTTGRFHGRDISEDDLAVIVRALTEA